MQRSAPLLALLLLSALGSAFADEKPKDPAAGHSYHGEAFNEGPRQAAVSIPGTGDVHMQVSTKSMEAQEFFDQGLGQLHGFWDFEAERSFRQVAAIDPDCAMAYWGMAMANFKNNTRGKGLIEQAVERKDKASEFEKMWIDGLAAYFKDPKADKKKRLRDFVRSLEKIVAKYPDDIEAQAFLLKQIYYNHRDGLPISSHFAVNLLADKILTADPDHPANHYQIHLWDRETPENALQAAANCGPAAPAIAHMWHMPGHIYSRLHRYADAVWQQEASARVDHAHMIRTQLIPDQIGNFAHNNEWCIRNMNSLGQVNRSIELAKNMISLPRLAKFKKEGDPSTYDPSGSSWQFGRQRLRDTYVRFEMWDELIAESQTHWLKPDGKSISDNDHDRFLGIAHFESGNETKGKEHLASLSVRLKKETTARDKAVASAGKKAKESGKKEKEIEAAKKAAQKNFQKKITTLENLVDELSTYAHLFAKKSDKDAATKLLPKLKNLPAYRHARLWALAGNPDKAIELTQKAVDDGKNEVLPLAIQTRIAHELGKKDVSETAMNQLRNIASHADLDSPALAAVTPIAQEFGFDNDWRAQLPTPPTDLGPRPDLDSLGPFRWTPPPAAPFSLSTSDGAVHSLSDYSGGPVLVIFYLGKGCSHCMEQLNAFAPVQKKFAAAGIEILAVSTDTEKGLAATFQKSGEKEEPITFPFPLVSDSALKTFRAYRAYDDFEKMPLHGTFLIDGTGQIRWQDISYEPFMYPDWLLAECERLLSLSKDREGALSAGL